MACSDLSEVRRIDEITPDTIAALPNPMMTSRITAGIAAIDHLTMKITIDPNGM